MDIEPETNITWREWEKTADKGLRYVINEGCAAKLLERIRDDMDKTASHVFMYTPSVSKQKILRMIRSVE